MQNVIITTGGTGGHIFPALAVAEEIQKRYPRSQVLFVGGEHGPEADLAVQAGLDFIGLPVKGVIGRGLKGLGALCGMTRGITKAYALMGKFRPQVVLGFGGYAAFAGVLAARLRGKRTAIHEQNAFPGVANRMLGRLVNRIFLSMPDASQAFSPAKCLLVGNPIRSGIARLYEKRRSELALDCPDTQNPAPAQPPRLLVVGGSQGARALNQGLLDCFTALLEAGVEIWHQTGKADYERVRAAYAQAGAEHVRVEAFIMDMPQAYAWADLIFCRAGASTLAEIAAAGLPALLSPFPFATHDHQRYNARYVDREGAAVILEQQEFYGEGANPSKLAEGLLALLSDKSRLRAMGKRSLALAKPQAAANLVDGLEALLMRG